MGSLLLDLFVSLPASPHTLKWPVLRQSSPLLWSHCVGLTNSCLMFEKLRSLKHIWDMRVLFSGHGKEGIVKGVGRRHPNCLERLGFEVQA